MARVKIILPEHFTFSCSIPVRVTDINYGGHLGNDKLLSLLHEARLQFLAHLGCSELNAFGAGLIMTDVAIIYKNEGHYGDMLQVEMAANDLSTRGFDLYYRIYCERQGQRVDIAHAKTGLLCFDYQQRKIATVPEGLKEKLQA